MEDGGRWWCTILRGPNTQALLEMQPITFQIPSEDTISSLSDSIDSLMVAWDLKVSVEKISVILFYINVSP